MAKAVIIGCGWQGMRHYKALQELGVEVSCILDINPKAVMKSLPDFPPERISDEAEDLLKRFHPDVAVIATNAAARLQNIKFCVEAGVKKIFCEKPMATSLQDAQQIIRITDEAGCLLSVNHLRRWSPNHLKLKKILESGVIGDIRHFYFQSGSVGLGNVGTHAIDNMRFYSGSEIDWVVGSLDETGTPNPRGAEYKDPGGWGMMMFKDGARAFVDTGEDTGVPHVFEMVGTYGRVVVEEMNNHWQIFARSQEDRNLPLTKYPTPAHEMPLFDPLPWDVKEFTKLGLKELIFENKTSCTGMDGFKALEVIIAFHVSHNKEGERLSFPLNNDFYSVEIAWP